MTEMDSYYHVNELTGRNLLPGKVGEGLDYRALEVETADTGLSAKEVIKDWITHPTRYLELHSANGFLQPK